LFSEQLTLHKNELNAALNSNCLQTSNMPTEKLQDLENCPSDHYEQLQLELNESVIEDDPNEFEIRLLTDTECNLQQLLTKPDDVESDLVNFSFGQCDEDLECN